MGRGYRPWQFAEMTPAGARSTEYSHLALSDGGKYEFSIPFAINDDKGTWVLQVLELTTGLRTEKKLQLK